MFSALAALDTMPDGGRIFLPALGRGDGGSRFQGLQAEVRYVQASLDHCDMDGRNAVVIRMCCKSARKAADDWNNVYCCSIHGHA